MMEQRTRRVVIPGWWWECWRSFWDEQTSSMTMTLSMDADELQLLVFLMADVRETVLSGQLEWQISESEVIKLCPGMKRLQQKASRVMELLGGLKALDADGFAQAWFCAEAWSVHKGERTLSLQLSPHMMSWVTGLGFYTQAHSHEWSRHTFSVSTSVFHELAGRDLDLYLRMEKAMHDEDHYVHADDVHGLAVSPCEMVTTGGRYRLRSFMRRLHDHGVVLPLGSSPVNAYESSSVFYWRDAKSQVRRQFMELYYQRVAQDFIHRYLPIEERVEAHAGEALCDDGLLIPLQWLYYEWSHRVKSDAQVLPVALLTTKAGKILQDATSSFEDFCVELKESTFYRFWIDLDASVSRQFFESSQNKKISSSQAPVVAFKNKKPTQNFYFDRPDVPLAEMKKKDPVSYSKIKRRFFESLKRDEKEALLNGSQSMDENEFELYLQRMLSVFVEKNPKYGVNSMQTH